MHSLAARRYHRSAPLVLVGFLLALIAGGFTVASSSSAKATTEYTEVDAIEGEKLFQANCSTCHGMDAEGTNIAPSLEGVGAAAVDFQVGTGRMPAVNVGMQAIVKDVQFTDEQIHQLAAYVAALGDGPTIPTAGQIDGTYGDAAAGGELFRINCAMCHGSVGGGGVLTQGKYAPALWSTEPIYIYEAMVSGPSNMPVFNDSNITPEGKRDIIAFLEAQRNGSPGGLDLGAVGPVTEAVWLWIVGLGLIISITVWVGARSS